MDQPVMRKNQITIFRCVRQGDETGISGTGDVLYGIRWPDGEIHVRWNTTDSSFMIFKTWAAFEKIHLKSHPTNNTIVQIRGGWKDIEGHENGGQYEWYDVESL